MRPKVQFPSSSSPSLIFLAVGWTVGRTSLPYSDILIMQLIQCVRLRDAAVSLVAILSGLAALSGTSAASAKGGVHLPMYRTVASTSNKRSNIISAVGLGDFLDV